MGFSPGIGFVHTGKSLSFVYDVADLYKTETTVPAAFRAIASAGELDLNARVRRTCRDVFAESQLLKRIVADLKRLFPASSGANDLDGDPALPGELWDPEAGVVAGGHAYGLEEES